jgi:hypothetical protein
VTPREALIRRNHAAINLHAGPCQADGPSIVCVLLAAIDQEREAIAALTAARLLGEEE